MASQSVPSWLKYPENGTRCMRNSCHCVQVACRAPPGPRGCGSPGAVSETDDKNRPKLNRGKRTPLYHLSPRDIQKGGCLNPRDTKGRDHKRSPIRVCGLTKECPVLDASRAIGSMRPSQSHPQGGCGVSWNRGPTTISGETHPQSILQVSF
jgi:hypothetical protein